MTTIPMRIAIATLHYDDDLHTPEALLERYGGTVRIASALQALPGVEVTLVYRFSRSVEIMAEGVPCRFVRDDLPARLGWRHRPRALAAACAAGAPDAVLVHGRPSALHTFRHAMPGAALLWQHHGGPDPRGVRRLLRRRDFSAADAVLVTACAIATRWGRMLPPSLHVFEVPESSSPLHRSDRQAARRSTGIDGDPAVLFIGRLEPVKDPLTAVRACAAARTMLPGLRLHMVGPGGPLEPAVRAEILARGLDGVVRMHERQPHDRIAEYCSAADVFLSSSRDEGSGFALLDALACGLAVAATDIPATRALAWPSPGARLWPPGDIHAAAEAVAAAWNARTPPEAIVRDFENRLSHAAVAATTAEACAATIRARRGEGGMG